MIERILGRSEESHERKTNDDEDVVIEEKESTVQNVLAKGQSLGADLESKLVQPLLLDHKSPSMSPAYSPPLSTLESPTALASLAELSSSSMLHSHEKTGLPTAHEKPEKTSPPKDQDCARAAKSLEKSQSVAEPVLVVESILDKYMEDIT